MIFEEEKIAGIDIEAIEEKGFNVVVNPKVLRGNVKRAVPSISEGIEPERLFVIVLAVVCILIPFIV